MAGGAAISTGGSAANQLLHQEVWWKNPRRVKLNLWILLLLITSYSNGYDGSMMNGLQILIQGQESFNYPNGSMLGLLNAIQNVGSLCATPFAPYVSDGIGRRYAVIWGASLMVIGCVVQTASQTVGMFIGARFLLGFGLTFAANAAPMLVSELAYPDQRAQLTSAYNSLWYSGSIVAAWTTFGTFTMTGTSWSWRIPSAIQAIPSVLQVLFMWWCPESPRYLMRKGREEEALRVLAHYHARGNENDPLVQFEFNEIREAIELDARVAQQVGWRTLFSTPGNRRRLRIFLALAFFSQWAGNGLVSYYLNKVLNSIGITNGTIQNLINGILQIYNLVVALVASSLVDRAGRRLLFLLSNSGILVFFTLQTIGIARYNTDGSSAAGNAVIAFIFLFYGFYDLAYTPLIVSYTVEILPYQLRAKGFTLFNFMVSLALIFNQYVNPVALDAIGWKYYIVYDCFLLFQLVYIWFFLVETKNRTLEETAAIFDGDSDVADLASRAAHDAHLDSPVPTSLSVDKTDKTVEIAMVEQA
ncbi:hexose transporter [Dacryopinax primogenitus]|uniref:Hexose transporter n=1 Tax=Dacryopinax primogenitus (strain DJM 731) TaxID=1858805 RepID=M5FT11_DACPD|nr:hexose transporter [Dacryopinax primogenitus]EJT99118.1 hexose transporter [Dacryopinax primogenitus]